MRKPFAAAINGKCRTAYNLSKGPRLDKPMEFVFRPMSVNSIVMVEDLSPPACRRLQYAHVSSESIVRCNRRKKLPGTDLIPSTPRPGGHLAQTRGVLSVRALRFNNAQTILVETWPPCRGVASGGSTRCCWRADRMKLLTFQHRDIQHRLLQSVLVRDRVSHLPT